MEEQRCLRERCAFSMHRQASSTGPFKQLATKSVACYKSCLRRHDKNCRMSNCARSDNTLRNMSHATNRILARHVVIKCIACYNRILVYEKTIFRYVGVFIVFYYDFMKFEKSIQISKPWCDIMQFRTNPPTSG